MFLDSLQSQGLMNVFVDGGAADGEHAQCISSIWVGASSLFLAHVHLKGADFETGTNHSESSMPPSWCRLGNPTPKVVFQPAPVALSVVVKSLI